mgnify:CR=1 FL=1
MEKNYRIVIDTLGSDKGPEAILEGAKTVLENNPNINLVLVGDNELNSSFGFPKEMGLYSYKNGRIISAPTF